MKILIITPNNIAHVGGVETVTKQIGSILSHYGTVSYITLGKSSLLKRFLYRLNLGPLITLIKYYLQRGYKADLVFCNGEYGFGIHSNRKIVLYHGSYLGYLKALAQEVSFKNKIQYKIGIILQRLAGLNSVNICVSQYVEEWTKSNKIKVDAVIPNFVDTRAYQAKKNFHVNNGRFLYIGSYNFYAKGMDILEGLVSLGFNIDIATPSNVPSFSKLKSIGNISHSEMNNTILQYKATILPSRFEGMSMAMLESMASGVPCISSNVGYGIELKSVFPTLVTTDNSVENFANLLTQLDEQGDLSIRVREFIDKNNSPSVIEAKWRSLFEKIIARK